MVINHDAVRKLLNTTFTIAYFFILLTLWVVCRDLKRCSDDVKEASVTLNSSVQHNIPCSFCCVLVLWNLFIAFFFLVGVVAKRKEISCAYFCFCSSTMCFRLLHIIRYKQFVNYVFFVHLLFQEVLLFT